MTLSKIPFSPVNIKERKKADIRPGDVVRVRQKITEGGKTRLQVFEGMVIARKHGAESGATFTVRRVSGGYGVEKIFPLYAPMIDKIEIVRRSKVRRAKLYYVKEKAAREIRRRIKRLRSFEPEVVAETRRDESDGKQKIQKEKKDIADGGQTQAENKKDKPEVVQEIKSHAEDGDEDKEKPSK